ncbi:hypothetical protein GYMLUDRAFT_83000 [Collybiopsis luxurians FD-317 M1]|nr:hypothetical protein GYMLUDRAFT_83000 [Collybiopsis luxurians FD-317 M1]
MERNSSAVSGRRLPGYAVLRRCPHSWSWDDFEKKPETMDSPLHVTLGAANDVIARIFFLANDNKSRVILNDLNDCYNIDKNSELYCGRREVSHVQDRRSATGDQHVFLEFIGIYVVRVKERYNKDTAEYSQFGLPKGWQEESGYYGPQHRNNDTNTLVTYLPNSNVDLSSSLLEWFEQAKEEDVREHSFLRTENPMFAVPPILWYTIYAWFDAFEIIYVHLNDLELEILGNPSTTLTRELHEIRNSLMSYRSMLDHFPKTVTLLFSTPTPGAWNDDFAGGYNLSGAYLNGATVNYVHGNLYSQVTHDDRIFHSYSDAITTMQTLKLQILLDAVTIIPSGTGIRHKIPPRQTQRTLIAGIFSTNVK